MTIAAVTVFTVLVGHALFDWVLQTRKMAETKCNLRTGFWLHILVYAIGLLCMVATVNVLAMLFATPVQLSLAWVIANIHAHALVDAVTSQITSRAWVKKRTKLFWNTIGIDQMIHYICLFGSTFIGL